MVLRPIHTAPSPDYILNLIQHVQSAKTSSDRCQQGSDRTWRSVWCRLIGAVWIGFKGPVTQNALLLWIFFFCKSFSLKHIFKCLSGKSAVTSGGVAGAVRPLSKLRLSFKQSRKQRAPAQPGLSGKKQAPSSPTSTQTYLRVPQLQRARKQPPDTGQWTSGGQSRRSFPEVFPGQSEGLRADGSLRPEPESSGDPRGPERQGEFSSSLGFARRPVQRLFVSLLWC